MTLPVFRKFSQEQVPGAPAWVENVFQPLNTFCDGTVQILDKNLVIGINVQGQVYSTQFTTPAGYATGSFNKIQLSYNGGGRPQCLILGSINAQDGTPIITACSVSNWTLNINVNPALINILYIAGLAASTTYYATFVAL